MADLSKGWEITNVILKPLGAFSTAIIVAIMGYWFNSSMSQRQIEDTNTRLYSELISQRERAESDLRKDMFTQVIKEFTKPETSSLGAKLLNLELLTYNFHESMNLKPLFMQLRRDILAKMKDDNSKADSSLTRNYLSRLTKTAREIVYRQLSAMESKGVLIKACVNWNSESLEPENRFLIDTVLTLEGIERAIGLTVVAIDPVNQEIEVALDITDPETDKQHVAEFGVTFFDFPTIDNMRLSKNQRCAVALNGLGESSGEVSVIYFPGRYASLKERSYYEDVISELRAQMYDTQ